MTAVQPLHDSFPGSREISLTVSPTNAAARMMGRSRSTLRVGMKKDDGGVPSKTLFDEKEGDWVWQYPVQSKP
jgi:hypothetical protein